MNAATLAYDTLIVSRVRGSLDGCFTRRLDSCEVFIGEVRQLPVSCRRRSRSLELIATPSLMRRPKQTVDAWRATGLKPLWLKTMPCTGACVFVSLLTGPLDRCIFCKVNRCARTAPPLRAL